MEESLSITTQPADYVGSLNSYASFSVAVNKEDVAYQWYFSNDGETWQKSGSAGCSIDILTVQIVSYRLGQRYRCIVTNEYGSVVSGVGVLKIMPHIR